MATWARGVSFKNSDNTKNIGGIGIYGNDTTAEKLYIGLGTEPWNNAGVQLTSSAINFKGNKIYHAGDKPTLSDIGAAAASHNHSSLSGVNLISFNAQSSDGVSIKTIINESATYLDMFMYDDVNQDKFRWRFKPHSTDSALTVERSLMELYCKTASTTNTAHLDLYGSFKATDTITAPTFSGALTGNASTATKLQTARSINGTNFDGTGNITTANWGTARNITIGNTSKSVNGSGNVAWSLSEIGAAASTHTHSYLPLTGGTLTGETVFNHYLSLNAWSGYGSGKAQLWYNGSNKQLVIQPNAVTDIIVNNNKVYHAGNKPTAADVGAASVSSGVQNWLATIKCATWSRILYLSNKTTVGHTGLLNIQGTRNSVVFNVTLLITTSHPGRASIVQLNNTNYSNLQIRALVNSNGDTYVEVYDNANSATDSITQTLDITFTTLSRNSNLTKYTSFTDGTTLPSGFSVGQTLTTLAGTVFSGNSATTTKLQTARSINGTNFDGSGNITTANWGTARNIAIGRTTKSVNGSANVSWSTDEIGALDKYNDSTLASDKKILLGHSSSWLTGSSTNGTVNLEAGGNLTLRGDRDCSSTGEFVSLKAGNNDLRVISSGTGTGQDRLTFNGNVVYHAGRKPSLSELGAAASSHTHSYIPLSGSTGITGPLRSNAEIQTTSQNAFRAVSGNYGFFIRNDGTNTYFMLTNSGDQYGNWNSLRPLAINNSTGVVTLGNGAIGNLQGNASTATKLAASKTIALSGDATGSASFDGSSNATINATVRKTCLVGSDAENTAGWYKVASQTMSGYGDVNITFAVTSTYAYYDSGILQLQVRSDNTSITCKRLAWHSRIGLSPSHYIVNVSGMTWTLYAYQPSSRYGRLMFEVISQSSINDKNSSFALHNTSTKESANPTATVTSSDAATVATANTLTTARNIKIGNTSRSFNGSGDVTWTLGDIGAAASSHTHTTSQITDATSNNIANTIVKRDGSGNISVGTIAGSLSGNATTATTLQNTRSITIGNTSKNFNGSSNVSWSHNEMSVPKTHVHYTFGGNQNAITTAQFISLLVSAGAFQQNYWISRGSWSYAQNQYINDTGCGNIHLAGSTIEVIGSTSLYTIRIHTPTTSASGVINGDFIYVNNGTDYSPGWRRIYNDKYKPSLTDIGAASASHNHDSNYVRQVNANGYYGITSNGSTSEWVRTTLNGLIPYQSGGSSSLGTSSWPFNDVYANNIYDNGVLLENKFADKSHSHSNYLSLSGGTVTGAITSSLTTSTHIAGNRGTAIINSTAAGSGYNMLAKMNSTNGVWTMGGWTDSFNLFYTANSVVSAGSNSTTKRLILLNEAGNSSFPGTVSASSFSGSLSGNATTATTLQNTRTINGTNFNGSANITTANWGTARTITIGSTGKSVNGSGNVSWSLSEIGAAPASHSHSNYVPTSEYGLTTISKTLTIGTSWMDTGIAGTNLATGSYMVQVSGMAHDATSFYSEIWTGVMSWYNADTNSTDADEIVLHKAGHASNGRTIYLRTLRVASSGTLKLQICASTALKATNVTFKFRKLI